MTTKVGRPLRRIINGASCAQWLTRCPASLASVSAVPGICLSAPKQPSLLQFVREIRLVQHRAYTQTKLDAASSPRKEVEDKQQLTPWHREGAKIAPVDKSGDRAGDPRGRLISTPSRLLKLVVPLNSLQNESDDASASTSHIEPLALLVHPQQPLSYLERLIQSELPKVHDPRDGTRKIPHVHFRARDVAQHLERTQSSPKAKHRDTSPEDLHEDNKHASVRQPDDLPPETSSLPMVRWSPSTEIGDFIRDAALSKEFSIELVLPTDELENSSASVPPTARKRQIYITVPSFNDRTHYLRLRLRKLCRRIDRLAAIKHECDRLAHKTAQRIALSGAGLLLGYWYLVYRLTFETELGWDTMEPVTYLVGLSGLIGGYLWFLWHNREVSYRAALKLTVDKRQAKLYEARGFDPAVWEGLIEEANTYRGEIRAVAREYDVEWDEKADEGTERVSRALAKERRKGAKEKDDGEDKEEEDEDGVVVDKEVSGNESHASRQ